MCRVVLVPGQRVHVVMRPDLLEAVDAAKGVGQSRGDFIRRTLEQALGGGDTGVPTSKLADPAPVGSTEPARSAAPARASEPRRETREEAFRRVTQGGKR